ncbi:MAG TPA: tRNA pseudouridine(55) synthase TruB [Candidatus Polarisedimenticolia bacterium]|nr:tRNA pseudouridine(55) synthase TruB [Candidatus Polarisedimenticolia bacterium]
MKELSGVLLLDKASGLTSHDVVQRVRGMLSQQRVGHTGTLDPLATGLLPLCLGQATRLSQFLTSSDKTYAGTIRFGWATDTHDREGKPLGETRAVRFSQGDLERALASLTGTITQIPPMFSAKKHGGVPMYRYARKNQEVPRDPVRVTIHRLTLLKLRGEEMDFEVKSSPGTYIRVLAHDLGTVLGCGAHLQDLRRTSCGDFQVEEAFTLERLEATVREHGTSQALIPLSRVPLGFPTVVANRAGLTAVRNGRALGIREILPSRSCLAEGMSRVESESGDLLAIARISRKDGQDIPVIQPQIVFAGA